MIPLQHILPLTCITEINPYLTKKGTGKNNLYWDARSWEAKCEYTFFLKCPQNIKVFTN